MKKSSLGLDFVRACVPLDYRYDDKIKPGQIGKDFCGFTAQDVMAALDEVDYKGNFGGVSHPDPEDEDGRYGLIYNQLIAPAYGAIDEIAIRLEAIEAHLGLS